MTHTYHIKGMTCNGCVAKVKSELLKLGDITSAEVQLAAPQATISMQKHIALTTLQAAISKAGNYSITEDEGMKSHTTAKPEEHASFIKTYKPLLLIAMYITGISFAVEFVAGNFDIERWMRHFMSGFFLVFSFFKLLDLKGFADGYSTYDIIAKKWRGWAFIYAFTELALGIAFLIDISPRYTNLITFIIMSISIIGVLQSIFQKRKIQCACLGTIFNLPMTVVTVVEDALMIAMSGTMLIML
ncbi:MAG: cation transporter [Agriterribacter sp.]